MGEWRITGRISPCPDGSLEVDLTAEAIRPKRQSAPRVSAMTGDDIAATIDLAKSEMPPELAELATQMVDLMASQNRGKNVALGRTLREVWAPLAKAAGSDEYAPGSLVWGMEQALAKGVPNVNYAKKAAKSYNVEAAPAAPAMTSRYDNLGGGSNAGK